MDLRDGELEPLAPAPLADDLERVLAELLLVRLALAERVVAELEVGDEHAVEKEARADSGAERDGELDPLPLDRAVALHVGVVGDVDRLRDSARERAAQVEVLPLAVELG